MGLRRFCDGCGCEERPDDGLQAVGLIDKLDYCPPCEQVVSGYLSERDKIHSDIVREWDERTGALRQALTDEHPRMSLPDE